tara:strand:- start:462 stop:884 length:423 start_codon:yes stop_codon:yes gene_type:complete
LTNIKNDNFIPPRNLLVTLLTDIVDQMVELVKAIVLNDNDKCVEIITDENNSFALASAMLMIKGCQINSEAINNEDIKRNVPQDLKVITEIMAQMFKESKLEADNINLNEIPDIKEFMGKLNDKSLDDLISKAGITRSMN